jgi:hypothetical protein
MPLTIIQARVAVTAVVMLARRADHSSRLEGSKSRVNCWYESSVLSTSAMRPNANIAVVTTSMKRRGPERGRPPPLRLFRFGVDH